MSKKQHTKEFKIDAVKYRLLYPEISSNEVAKNLGIGCSTLQKWVAEYKKNNATEVRGSGNFSNDVEKENARLRRELKNTKDALEILKKAMGILAD